MDAQRSARDTSCISAEADLVRSSSFELPVDHLDLDREVMLITGKGRRQRSVPLGARSVAALDRYLRVRAGHPPAGRSGLWLGIRGPFTTSGLYLDPGVRCGADGVWRHPERVGEEARQAYRGSGRSPGLRRRAFGSRSTPHLASNSVEGVTMAPPPLKKAGRYDTGEPGQPFRDELPRAGQPSAYVRTLPARMICPHCRHENELDARVLEVDSLEDIARGLGAAQAAACRSTLSVL